MGTTEEHMVPKAELIGLILGLHLIHKEKRQPNKLRDWAGQSSGNTGPRFGTD
jgi:hypothetical protein